MEDLTTFIQDLEKKDSRIGNHFQDRNMLITSLKELNDVIGMRKIKSQIVKQIKTMLELAQNRHSENYKKYIIYMKKQYDKDKYDVTYNKGDLVAYFVGDKTVGNVRKLSRKYTGPWIVISQKRHNCVKIQHTVTKQTLVVH